MQIPQKLLCEMPGSRSSITRKVVLTLLASALLTCSAFLPVAVAWAKVLWQQYRQPPAGIQSQPQSIGQQPAGPFFAHPVDTCPGCGLG